MRTFKTWLVTMAALLCSITVNAESVQIDGIWYNLITKAKQAEVTKPADESEYLGDISIPATIIYNGEKYSVTAIGASAFGGCSDLTSITIPEGITSIKNGAFTICTSLTSINIPKSVTLIEGGVFYGCKNLTTITISENVTSIGAETFWGCSSLTSVTIPKGVTSIEIYTFYGCGNLTSITIPEGVTSIKDFAFQRCTNLTSINIPKSVTLIGAGAFSECKSITSITIPEGVASIVYSAFNGCNNLVSITIPNGVTSIGDYAFSSCSSLISITLPESVRYIYESAFSNCPELTDVYCHAEIVPSTNTNTFKGSYIEYATLHVPESSLEAYKSADIWKDFGEIKPIKKDAVINDATQLFEKNEDEECASITYTRTFNNTNWQALYVPFELPVTEEFLADFEVADFNDIRQYDRDDDGVKDETVVEAFKVKSGATLAANYPYLIRAKEVGEKTITVTDATLYATEEVSIDCSSVHEKFTFTGTYSRKASDELAGCYALCDGVWQPLAADATLGAFRVYLRIESRDSNIAPARAIRMHVVGEDGATDIDELESNANNQQPAVVYDLQGRRITNVDNLKGVYIVNGKKVVK